MEERLQKILAHAGVGSRRECEKLIVQGCVTVNGSSVTEFGLKIDPATSAIKVNGKRIKVAVTNKAYHYLMLHKPRGYLTTMKPDKQGRFTLLDLLPARIKTRVYPVGRLDFNSEGLILLTNDGELTYRLTHPKFKLPKTYEVKVHDIPSEQVLKRLSQGIKLEDGKTWPASVKILRITGKNAWLLFTIHEGRKRQIRRMCEKVHLPVSKLRRIKIGPITLNELKKGHFRFLLPEEVQQLKKAVKLDF
jgi:23S rRNA pseudouridine2605 synthase/16S rRNA pseudouridine516 synthase